ncbi:hypothetical protein [Ferviditalea candida]|uniref:Uncharacterized protein n=1 Tax=Ferviditalea candida TaxID=3108399 RepID=A0ABU5ZKE3_9BACL|nr:hypothetical protein [Paenibacillaceae bacterium T2]
MQRLMIDAETLNEFLGKAEPLLSEEQIMRIVFRLEQRSKLAPDLLGRALSEGDVADAAIWNWVPATRRLSQDERARFTEFARTFLAKARNHSTEEALELLDHWDERPKWGLEWATFWLHLSDPSRFPWWTRWMYTPETHTGAVLLVLDDPDVIQPGQPPSFLFSQIQLTQQVLSAVLEATHRMDRVPDIYRPILCLSWVYAVYMFTMASWRMTSEFTQVLPPFPKVVEGLLGIKHMGGSFT